MIIAVDLRREDNHSRSTVIQALKALLDTHLVERMEINPVGIGGPIHDCLRVTHNYTQVAEVQK